MKPGELVLLPGYVTRFLSASDVEAPLMYVTFSFNLRGIANIRSYLQGVPVPVKASESVETKLRLAEKPFVFSRRWTTPMV